MRRKRLLLALGFGCAAGLLGSRLSCPCRAAEAPEIKLLTREVSLGKLDPGMSVQVLGPPGWLVVAPSSEPARFHSLVVSPDSRRVLYVARRGGKELVVVDGVEGKGYDEILDGRIPVPEPPVFSPDSRRVAYAARRGGEWLVVVDGVEGKKCDTVGAPVFSPDSRRVAYGAARGDKGLVVVDGIEREVDGRIYRLMFSPDSRHVAYEVVRGFPNSTLSGKESFAVDGVEGKAYDLKQSIGGLRGFVFSPDSRRVAYVAELPCRDPQTGLGKEFVVVDGVEGKEYDLIYLEGSKDTPLFSPDSRRVAYMARLGGKLFMVVDGVEGKEGSGSPVFSPDGRRLAYLAAHGGKQLVVVDSVEGKEYPLIYFPGMELAPPLGGPPVFSPDSKRVAYAACDLEPSGEPARPGTQTLCLWSSPAAVCRMKCLVVVDGVEGKGYDGIIWDPPVFSPDSRRVAYTVAHVAQPGDSQPSPEPMTQWVVVDGVEGKEYGAIGRESLVFSPDSRRVAYVAGRGGKQLVVVDGVEGDEYGAIQARPVWPTPGVLGGSLVFSPDSRHVAYLANRGDKQLVVVDGVEGKEYQGFLMGSRLVFDSPTQLHALAVNGGDFFRVEIEIVSAGAESGARH
jgi:Tol biopolymer transport system component